MLAKKKLQVCTFTLARVKFSHWDQLTATAEMAGKQEKKLQASQLRSLDAVSGVGLCSNVIGGLNLLSSAPFCRPPRPARAQLKADVEGKRK